jgi:hypothetical protein
MACAIARIHTLGRGLAVCCCPFGGKSFPARSRSILAFCARSRALLRGRVRTAPLAEPRVRAHAASRGGGATWDMDQGPATGSELWRGLDDVWASLA